MGLVSNLCSELGVAPELLARIVGLPADRVARWGIGGVPPHHHSDFRTLEDLVELVRQHTTLPIRSAIRIDLPALQGSSILQMLVEQGPLFVLDRLRAELTSSGESAHGTAAGAKIPPPAEESRSVA